MEKQSLKTETQPSARLTHDRVTCCRVFSSLNQNRPCLHPRCQRRAAGAVSATARPAEYGPCCLKLRLLNHIRRAAPCPNCQLRDVLGCLNPDNADQTPLPGSWAAKDSHRGPRYQHLGSFVASGHVFKLHRGLRSVDHSVPSESKCRHPNSKHHAVPVRDLAASTFAHLRPPDLATCAQCQAAYLLRTAARVL